MAEILSLTRTQTPGVRGVPKLICLVTVVTESSILPFLHRTGAATPHGVLMEGCSQSCLTPLRAHKLDFLVPSALE